MKLKVDVARMACVAVSAVLSSIGFWLHLVPASIDIGSIVAILIGGYPIFKEAYFNLRSRSITVEVAMSIGIAASAIIGEHTAALVIVLFTLFSEYIEELTIERGRKAVESLVNLAPTLATVRRNGKETTIDVSEVIQGDTIIVKPGGKIPVDGTVTKGTGQVNQAPITGESMPVTKESGDRVFAGSFGTEGVLEIQAERVGSDTTLSRIIQLVEEAEAQKAPVQRFADVFASRFVPIILAIGVIVFALTLRPTTAIAVIVVACPCAISLATPLAVVASVGSAAKKGIIIKGGAYLEELGKVDTVVVDKTGTLTLGEPSIIDIRKFGDHDEKEILLLAATTELHSEHPIAKAVEKRIIEYGIDVPEHRECQIVPGKGVICSYTDTTIFMGNRELLRDHNIEVPEGVDQYMQDMEETGSTPLILAHDNHVCGILSVADTVRSDAAKGIQELRRLGIKSVIMLTGDNIRTAKQVGEKVGVDEIVAELLPQQKAAKIKELVDSGHRVLMVGDGINDAPALAQASVGVAMGVAGTAATIETADVALMTDNFLNVAEAVKIGRRASSTIRQNIIASMIFNVVGVTLASLGILSPELAAIAHSLPDIALFLNSARLIRFR
ncbi:cation-translocating P-type ATPase [Candidatus Bathyarchaeota archaeon]|nr:cation-translocating P-type ATPase [Candidatus Bathyarchaeota archaeon]